MIQTAAYEAASDTHTYTATVMSGAPATLAAAAPSLVSGGAFITAFGQIDATSYARVATAVSGMTTPRSVMIGTDATHAGTEPDARALLSQGYAVVGGYFDASNAPQFILEKWRTAATGRLRTDRWSARSPTSSGWGVALAPRPFARRRRCRRYSSSRPARLRPVGRSLRARTRLAPGR